MNLQLPSYPLKIKKENHKDVLFDVVRKKYVRLTPEEWVRQHWVHYLIENLGIPGGLISIEKGLKYNQRQKRSDLVIYDRTGTPWLLMECKAPSVALSNEIFLQTALYYAQLKTPYLMITNGRNHLLCEFNIAERSWHPKEYFPEFPHP